VLDSFGGGRVIIGVTSTPFKCPPAPSETALMLHDYLVERGLTRCQPGLDDGKGICYIEFGHDRVARVEVTFRSGERPNGQFDEPSDLLLADKAEPTSRIRRWFDRNWTSY
jgi:hypothetical protein